MKDLLRNIPKVDDLLRSPALMALSEQTSRQAVTQALRSYLDQTRQEILQKQRDTLPTEAEIFAGVGVMVENTLLPSLRSVINGTGVVLHTNLGRATLSAKAVEAVTQVAKGYSTLEYDLSTGGRGERYTHVNRLLTSLTGGEDALVVNNNAAAVLLILSALATGGQVITSRGELVEIGGSFRVPEIMESCGCILREVGATNKTHLHDYESAICPETRALLRVHTSNYKILGFTHTVPLKDLVKLGQAHGLPVIEDLGSGSLCNLNQFGIADEPTVQESIQAGMDIVSFSGDKLLGGPQAGIIVGKKEYIKILKKHPLTRAMRVDKMTLAALEATLQSYAQEKSLQEIPVLRMLGATPDILQQRGKVLAEQFQSAGISAELLPEQGQVGGGSVPTQLLPTFVVAISWEKSLSLLETRLRQRPRPIIGRIAHEKFLLDLRTLEDEDFSEIVQTFREVMT